VTRIGQEIQDRIDAETKAWETQDVGLLLSLFHPHMVWVWPPREYDHDPMTWEMVLGKYNNIRWRRFYRQFFLEHQLIHNRRCTRKIEVSQYGDAAFAIVDIDTLWEGISRQQCHWFGRVCKAYTKVGGKWLIIMHTGALEYAQ